MRVVDAGHEYLLDSLDGGEAVPLTFVKREGDGYPGNIGHHPGTNLQEVLRALIDRTLYLNRQIPDYRNIAALKDLRYALWGFEIRAAERHGRLEDFVMRYKPTVIETYGTCDKCGHIGCEGGCHE